MATSPNGSPIKNTSRPCDSRHPSSSSSSLSASSSLSKHVASSLVPPMALSSVHPDLQRERRSCSFSVGRMGMLIFGRDTFCKYAQVRKVLAHNANFDARQLWWITGSERYIRACKQAEEFIRVVRQHKLMEDPTYMNSILVLTGEDFFVHVHLVMFLPSIQNLADDEQKREWLPAATDFTILGTYAQTELGHGSNVAGLETTADFDQGTDEWILNTPTLTATKWWAGGLGKSCTHCVLMARLRIRGSDYGIHAFMLQIRDLKTHESLRGIVLQHLGQKLGYNGMDNGTMQLHHVRIPRRNLFMRFCSVDRHGSYVRQGDPKLLYATMTFTRKQIIMNAGVQLMKNCVIATRYSAVRRQFAVPTEAVSAQLVTTNTVPEAPVLDYLTQQHMLFPLIATALAFWFTSDVIDKLYDDIMNECNHSDFSRLPDIHALTSALKAMMTYTVLDGIETCRKACGGHGFALAAGIPLHLTTYAPQATYEGDFVVLSIQAGRVLLKAVENRMKGKTINRLEDLSFRYLYDFDPYSEHPQGKIDWMSYDWQISAYKQRSCSLTYKTAEAFAAALARGLNVLQALDEIKIELNRVAKAYANVVVLECFQKRLDSAENEFAEERRVVTILRSLFALHWIEREFGEFVVSRVLSGDDYDLLMQTIKNLLKEVRPIAVSLTDSVGMPDYLLNSALGRYDGRVYEALFKATHYEPLNSHDVTEGYYRHLQFVLHPERKMPSFSTSKL